MAELFNSHLLGKNLSECAVDREGFDQLPPVLDLGRLERLDGFILHHGGDVRHS